MLTPKRIACLAVMSVTVAGFGVSGASAASTAPALWYRYQVEFEGAEVVDHLSLSQADLRARQEMTTKWTLESDHAFLLTRLPGGAARFSDRTSIADDGGEGKITSYSYDWVRPAFPSTDLPGGARVSCTEWRIKAFTDLKLSFKGSLNSPSTSDAGLSLRAEPALPPRFGAPPELAIGWYDGGYDCTRKHVDPIGAELETTTNYPADTHYEPCCPAWSNKTVYGTEAVLGFPHGQRTSLNELLRFKIPKGKFGKTFEIWRAASFRQLTGERRTYRYTIKFTACPHRGRDVDTC